MKITSVQISMIAVKSISLPINIGTIMKPNIKINLKIVSKMIAFLNSPFLFFLPIHRGSKSSSAIGARDLEFAIVDPGAEENLLNTIAIINRTIPVIPIVSWST